MELYNESNAIHTLDTNSVLTNTFFRMFLGLLASALTAFWAYHSGLYLNMVLNCYFYPLLIVELVVVFIFSLCFKRLSPTAVTILFFAYAFLNGFTLSVIFAVYEMSSITYAFLGTSALFGVLAYLGHNTGRDLSNMGTMLTVALFIGLILTFINMFIGNSLLDVILDWAILFIFCGLTAYDVNKIKRMQEIGFCDDEKLYVYGAMELYLDFINMFLRILSIFGKRRN